VEVKKEQGEVTRAPVVTVLADGQEVAKLNAKIWA
jgi:hypothetical protein